MIHCTTVNLLFIYCCSTSTVSNVGTRQKIKKLIIACSVCKWRWDLCCNPNSVAGNWKTISEELQQRVLTQAEWCHFNGAHLQIYTHWPSDRKQFWHTRNTWQLTATVGVLNLCEGEKWVTGLQSPTTLLYTTKSCTLLLYWDELCSRVGQLVEYISCGHTSWAEEQFILIRPELLIAGTEERSGRSFILFLSFESSVCFTQLMSQLNLKHNSPLAHVSQPYCVYATLHTIKGKCIYVITIQFQWKKSYLKSMAANSSETCVCLFNKNQTCLHGDITITTRNVSNG